MHYILNIIISADFCVIIVIFCTLHVSLTGQFYEEYIGNGLVIDNCMQLTELCSYLGCN